MAGWKLVAMVVAAVGAVLGAGAAVSWASDEGEADRTDAPARITVISPVDHSVEALELWKAGLEVVDCFRSNDVAAFGPYPKADGSGLHYSVRVTPATPSIEARCASAFEPLAYRFALDHGPQGVPTEEGSTGAHVAVPPGQPATADARALAAVRLSIANCLDLAPDGGPSAEDAALADASFGDPDAFAACVDAAH
ncbi:hypothetical protein KSP35_20590 [Aquihabitans sp. G128]|uniref:hypothetical protein n=1 Tax=Aquihabitans sp. G128 TaxID=2849779 RepID=UPI001C241930|nr:hypothetical protein [Aquihabitans sp. G128]QXC60691.1 hypothetical protein KSP35_20590 [Aquihabitans sp. G128]